MYLYRYEENYFMRLPATKQERHRARKMTTLGTLGDELTRFGDLRSLEGGAGASGSSGTSKKRKRFKGKKSKYLPSSISSKFAFRQRFQSSGT
jgi:U3 small nucleolar ribonucleoprotein protein LCP5